MKSKLNYRAYALIIAFFVTLSSSLTSAAPPRRSATAGRKPAPPAVPTNLVSKKIVYQDAEARAIARLLGIDTAVASERKFTLVKAPSPAPKKKMTKATAVSTPTPDAATEDLSKFIVMRFAPGEETTTLEMDGLWSTASGRPGYAYIAPFIEDGELKSDDLSNLIRKVMPELVREESRSTQQIGASTFEHTVGSNFVLTVHRLKTGARKSKGQWGYQILMKADQG